MSSESTSLDQRARVRSMLQNLRFAGARTTASQDSKGGTGWLGAFQSEASPTTALDAPSQRTPGAAVAAPVFTHQRAAGLVGGGTRGGRGGSSSEALPSGSRVSTTSEAASDATSVVVWVLSALALTGVFLVIGQWVDARLADDDDGSQPPQVDTPDTPSSVGTDYGTVALKTCFQIVFNVAMLLVPYLLLRHYAPHTLLYRHYLYVVFPLWVVSLQAQPLLKERLRVLLAGEFAPEVDDATKLAKLVAQAEADKAQAEADAAKQRKRRRRSATSGATAVTEGFIRGHTRLPPSAVRAQRLQPDSRGTGMDTAPWSSFQQEADQTVQFSSPLLDGGEGGGQVAAPPPAVVEPFEFSGQGGEAAPRHTDLAALMGA